MRCLVTGASGFVGAHLVHWLVENGCQVAALVRPQGNLWRLQNVNVLQNICIIEGDLFDIAPSVQVISEFAPEIVFHLGWSAVSGKNRDDPSQIQNLYSSLNLLNIAHRTGCHTWIGLGSQAEYGRYDNIISEDTPTRPFSWYGLAKLCVGLLSQRLCTSHGIRFVWLRLFATYGPMDHPTFLIPYVILTLLDGKKPVLTWGEQRWDYLFIEDTVQAIWQTAIMTDAQGIFNLGSGNAIPVRCIVENIRDLINPYLPLGFGEANYSPNQIMLLQADISRLCQTIGWSPHTSLAEGLAKTVQWYRQNIQLYERSK